MTVYKSFLIILLSTPLLITAQTTEKTMIKSFNLSGKDQILLQIPGNVAIKTWEKTSVQIQITVSLPNGNSAMLDALAEAGRYDLAAKTDGGTLIVSADNLGKIIKVKGLDLKENIVFHVFAPRDTPVKIFDPATAAVEKK